MGGYCLFIHSFSLKVFNLLLRSVFQGSTPQQLPPARSLALVLLPCLFVPGQALVQLCLQMGMGFLLPLLCYPSEPSPDSAPQRPSLIILGPMPSPYFAFHYPVSVTLAFNVLLQNGTWSFHGCLLTAK